MATPAAIQATFADFKIIRGRKIAQIICEIPLEQADVALSVLGGIPNPATEAWIAICRLDLSKAKEPGPDTRGVMNVGLEHHEEAQKPKRKMAELPLSQQAAILCARESFQRFLREENGYASCVDAETSAEAMREICGVGSRSEFDRDREARNEFLALDERFNDWLNMP